MNPIGDVKGFILDVMKNIAIVFGMGYMGGSLVALTHLDNAKLDKILPIDLNQSPYVGEKSGFSLTGYGFPYSLYTKHPDFFSKVMNWLIMTCALTFISIRSFFRWIASFDTSKISRDIPLFYIVPFFLIQVAMYSMPMFVLFLLMIFFYSIFIGDYVLQKEQMKNSLWYWLAPMSFWFAVFSSTIEPGFFALMTRLFFSFLAFLFGWLALLFLYPLWWTAIVFFAILYYIFFLFFSPFLYGIEKVINEMGHHRLSLTILFMFLTILSANTYLTQMVTTGIVVGSIFMVYLLL
jgi:hypothetical protein